MIFDIREFFYIQYFIVLEETFLAYCAAEGGHIEVLMLLIEHKCPMYLTDDSGDTPADIAAVYGHKAAGSCSKETWYFILATKRVSPTRANELAF